MSTAGTPEHLLQRWGHSFEEDHDGVQVFRPAGFAFPRARGRDGIEFRADGTYIDWAIGRGDGSEARPGTWGPAPDGSIHITGSDGRPRVVDLVLVDPDRLELRDRPA